MFIRGKKKPIEYPADAPFTSEDIRKFFKKETGLHLSLPGCIPNLDVLALSFTKASDDKKTAALDKAKKLTGELGDHVIVINISRYIFLY